MDQCTHCTLKGNINECEKVECGIHDSWYVSALKTKEFFNNSPATPVQQTQPGNSLSNELGIVIAAGCDNVEIYNDVMKNVNAVLANFGLA